jgi:hypothetical protein
MKILYGQELVNELRRKADLVRKRIWIAVPYIGGLKSVRRIIGKEWIENSKLSIRLLTDTNEFNNFNSETINLFHQIGDIMHLPGLHAKIYIIDDFCLITSANLTDTAFTKRHEIGIFLDEEQSAKTISIFSKWWTDAEVVSNIIIKKYKNSKSQSSEEASGSKLKPLWNLPPDNYEINYWLKPIGAKEEPVLPSRIFKKEIEYLHFSKRKPTGVKLNDILIAYGVGARTILSVYQNTSSIGTVTSQEIIKKPRLKRWPFYVIGKNLTPIFGSQWAKHNLVASKLVEEYLEQNPDGFITKVKGKNLNALMYSSDKIKLHPDFARFIIQKVNNIQN